MTDDLCEFRSGLLPGQIIQIEREEARERYAKLAISNAVGYGAAVGMKDEEILAQLPDLIFERAKAAARYDRHRIERTLRRIRARMHFITSEGLSH